MQAEAANQYVQIAFFVILIAAFYLLIIRPYKVRNREHQKMVSELNVGDRVVTIGGIHGKIRGIKGNLIELEVAPKIILTLNKGAVASRSAGTQEKNA